MEELEKQLEKALKKNQEITEKNALLTRSNHSLAKELEKSKMENVKNQNLLTELNKWIENLTEINRGNEKAYEKLNQGLDDFFGVEEKIYEIRKELVDEKFRSLDLKEENSFLKEQLRVLKNELSSTNEGMLLLEKISLEETLNQLINEVEFLSTKNDKMLNDLKQKDFYECYHKTVLEMEKLRSEYEKLLKYSGNYDNNSKNPRMRNSYSFSKIKLNCKSSTLL